MGGLIGKINAAPGTRMFIVRPLRVGMRRWLWRCDMSGVKVAVTIDSETLKRVDALAAKKVFPNRSRAVQAAVAEKLARIRRGAKHLTPILRGEIRWADLNPMRGREQAGSRPVLVLSHDVFNDRSGTVTAVALASQEQRAGFPLTLELKGHKLPKRSWAEVSQIRTLSVERICKRTGRATPEEISEVVEGLNEVIVL